MAQHDYNIANQSGAAVRGDINNALLAVVSNNSGSSAPTTTYAYMFWYDTGNGLLKQRNGADNAWVTIGPLADTSKHEIYVNNSVVVTIDSNGVGINDTTPAYDLDVTGDINFTGTLYNNGTPFTASPTSISQGNTNVTVADSGSNGTITMTTEGTERMRISNAGELMVNTTSAVTNAIATITKGSTAVNMLVIGSSGAGYVKIGTNDSGSDYQLLPNGGCGIYTSSAKDIVFGTDNTEICRLKNSDKSLTFASGKYPVAKNVPKAWVNFNGTGTVAVRDSFNVASITDNGTGDYTINFTNAMSDANYCVSITTGNTAGTNIKNGNVYSTAFGGADPTTSALRIIVNSDATGANDNSQVHVMVMGA